MCLGIPAKVIELYESNGIKMAKVDFGGVIKEACMEYLPEVKVGDYTIIHVGFGLSILDEQEARETIELLRQIDAGGKKEQLLPPPRTPKRGTTARKVPQRGTPPEAI